MHRIDLRAEWLVSALAISALLLSAGSLRAQNNPGPLTGAQFGVGFVGNAPDAFVGGGVYVVVPELGPISGGIGLYVDAKFDLDDAADERAFNGNLTSGELLGDPGRQEADFVRRESSWMSVNVALIRPLTPFLMVYGGGGMARATRYELFNVNQADPAGVGGVVWTENPDLEETRVNLMVGIVMRLTSAVSTHFGFETQPRGLTVGASLRLPKW